MERTLKIQRHFEFGEPYMLVDAGGGETWKLGRVVGGVAWPHAGRPGFVVVVGEDFEVDRDAEVRHLRVMDEAEDFFGVPFLAVEPLLGCLADLRGKLHVSRWNGLPCPQPEALREFNRRRAREKKIGVMPAELDDPRFGAMLDLVYRRTVVHKTLHFGESVLPGRLSALPADAGDTRSFQDHPEITALLFAVSGLDTRPANGSPVQARRVVVDRVAGY